MMKALAPSGSMFMSFSSPKSSRSSPAAASPPLVAGMDISEWELVQVPGVRPGPLGILLNGNYPDAAVLDDFAPISSDGTKGSVELDGRIVVGSVLVGVNEIDLLASKLSLQEVGRVLRDTSHAVRTLHFKVPPTRALDALDASGVGTPTGSAVGEELLKGMDKSSYREQSKPASASETDGAKRSWNFKSLLSPSQIAGSVAALSGFASGGSTPAVTPPGPPLRVETAAAPALAPAPAPALASPSPSSAGLRSPSPTLRVRSLSDSGKLAVKIPPGPIGLNLDGSIADRAVVQGFLPLPDGSTGVLERRGDIPRGSVLVAINGSGVTHLTLDEIRARLGALAGFDRELVFELPPPDDGEPRVLTAKQRAAAFDRLGDLDKRRKIELALVLKHDRATLKRHECWLLLDARWMARWVEFTSRGGVNPGPISNHTLLETDWAARASGLAPGRPDAPRGGLSLMTDYRCVTPMTWALLSEFHGTNNVPVQARYVLDAYAEPLAETDFAKILQAPRLKAATLVHDLQEQYPTAFA